MKKKVITNTLSELLNDYSKIEKKKNFDFLNKKQQNNHTFKLFQLTEILSKVRELKLKEKELSLKTSINFNVLNFFSIGETLHSRLLGFFLQPHETHGQNDLFLKKFLKAIGITNYEEGKWNVTIEVDRIDILIWRAHPHSVVIIENKSNNAGDQENQIYRYWYRAIYQKNNKDIVKASDNSNYKIIYLVSNDWKKPSENTLQKPSSFTDEELPESIPDTLNPTIWQFKNEIRKILESCLCELNEENYRLRSYIEQYINYWN